MPPFASKEEKKQFILANKIIFDALKIKLTDEYIRELVDDTSREEEYEKAHAIMEKAQRIESEAAEYITPSQEIMDADLKRLVALLYDPSGTPEAKKWNSELKAIAEGENACRKISDLCLKAILDFDDTIMASEATTALKFVEKYPEKANLMFGTIDIIKNAHKFYNMNDPKEAAVVNAAADKFLLSQGLNCVRFAIQYSSSKLSVILPTLNEKQTEKLIEYLNNKIVMDDLEEEEAEELHSKLNVIKDRDQFIKLTNEHNSFAPVVKSLIDKKFIGPGSEKYRAYKMVDGKKEYINKYQVMKTIFEKNSTDVIKSEEISKDEQKHIANFVKYTTKIGTEPLWPNKETKRLYLETILPVLAETGYNLTDEEVDRIVDDTTNDVSYIQAREFKEISATAKRKFQIIPESTVAQSTSLATAMHIYDGSVEANEWNENVMLLSQTNEGLALLSRIAVARLLSVDMGQLLTNDEAAREKYLASHPIERQLCYSAERIRQAYESTLSDAEKKNNPVVNALGDRAALFEGLNDDLFNIKAKGSRILPMLPGLDVNNLEAIHQHFKVKLFECKDPEKRKILQEASDDFDASYQAQKQIYKNPGRAMGNTLYNEKVIKKDSLYKRPYINVTTKDDKGKDVVTRKYYTYNQMIDAIASKELKKEDFQFEERSKEDVAKIKDFIARAPKTPVFMGKQAERERARLIAVSRTIRLDNNAAIKAYAKEKSEDMNLDPELRELYANALGAREANTSEVVAKAFTYVCEHMKYDKNPVEKEKLEVALTTVAMLDGTCAKELSERINREREYGDWFSHPHIDLNGILKKSGIKLGLDAEKENFNFRDPFDKRAQNIKTIYDELTSKWNPWYHHNSDEFNTMLQKMRNLLDYATISQGADKGTVEILMEEVKEAANNYARRLDTWQELGRNRRSAAIAAVSVIDYEEGKKLLNDLRFEKKWLDKASVKLDSDRDSINVEKFLENAMAVKPLNKQEITDRMLADIEETKKLMEKKRNDMVADPKIDGQAALNEIGEISAQLAIKKSIYKNVCGEKIDTRKIIDDLSHAQVKEATEKLEHDDVYRSVLNKIKINQDQNLDRLIDEIDAKYQAAKQPQANAQNAENNNQAAVPNTAINAPKA